MKDESDSEVVWWDGPVFDDEVRRLGELSRELHNIAEGELRQRFGEPDEVINGSSESVDNQVTFQADYDLRYHSIFPHTTVSFSIFDERVHHFCCWPKVRSCPPEMRAGFGQEFAPD